MLSMAVYEMTGEKTGDIEIPEEILGVGYNADLVRQAVAYVDAQRKRRCGTTKRRSEVVLTKGKWYRQKGLGRARHGARSAPLFVGGGVAHGPTGEQRSFSMPKRMRRKALLSALSQRAREGNITIVERLRVEEISTQGFIDVLGDLEVEGRLLMVLGAEEAADETLYKSSRNIPDVIAREAPHFNTRDVLWAEEILMTRAGLEQLIGGDTADAD